MVTAVRPERGGFPITGHLPRQGSDEHKDWLNKVMEGIMMPMMEEE